MIRSSAGLLETKHLILRHFEAKMVYHISALRSSIACDTKPLQWNDGFNTDTQALTDNNNSIFDVRSGSCINEMTAADSYKTIHHSTSSWSSRPGKISLSMGGLLKNSSAQDRYITRCR